MTSISVLKANLSGMTPRPPAVVLQSLIAAGLDQIPLPGHGQTLERWRWLSTVGEYDLSLAKLYEGHTDALAIASEFGVTGLLDGDQSWGVWAADPPAYRLQIVESRSTHALRLRGVKQWCSGAGQLSHALVTAWRGSDGPYLVAVALQQDGIKHDRSAWHAVGMQGSASLEVHFRDAFGFQLGGRSTYLSRPGFWHGGAGVASCWFGGAVGLARNLRLRAIAHPHDQLLQISLGAVDLVLQQSAALFTCAAAEIDLRPTVDFHHRALQCRAAAESTVQEVMQQVGRALGPAPFCQDPGFAQRAADLQVFIRQTQGNRDLVALGKAVMEKDRWTL